jgi:hypothetical protein
MACATRWTRASRCEEEGRRKDKRGCCSSFFLTSSFLIMYSDPRPNISLTRLALALIVFVAGVWWAIGATTNGDPLWFWTRFDATPTLIVLYYRGQTVEFRPGQPGFSELTQAFNTEFSQRRGWFTLGVSPESADDYRQREVALAFYYAQPVTVRSQYRFGPHRGLFLPLTGRHSELHPVWGLDGAEIVPGAMRLESITELNQTLRQLGYTP